MMQEQAQAVCTAVDVGGWLIITGLWGGSLTALLVWSYVSMGPPSVWPARLRRRARLLRRVRELIELGYEAEIATGKAESELAAEAQAVERILA